MTDGFDRATFNHFKADCKRAARQLSHTRQLAEANGVGDEALASACLNAAAELMTRSGGRDKALATMRMAMDRIAAGDYETAKSFLDARMLN